MLNRVSLTRVIQEILLRESNFIIRWSLPTTFPFINGYYSVHQIDFPVSISQRKVNSPRFLRFSAHGAEAPTFLDRSPQNKWTSCEISWRELHQTRRVSVWMMVSFTPTPTLSHPHSQDGFCTIQRRDSYCISEMFHLGKYKCLP